MNTIDTDVVVIGAGAAGLMTALSARGRRVCVLTADDPTLPGAASDLAQGGIAAAVGLDDTPALHAKDTMAAGCKENAVRVTRFVCEEGPGTIAFLHALGVPFTRERGAWSLHREAAHTRARVLHANGDQTGAAIMATLRGHVAEASHIEMLPHTKAVRLLVNGAVNGVLAIGLNGQPLAIRAHAVVIATGGIGGLYSRSTNPIGACGDGLAMAIEAGARATALPFVQFHPTALNVDARPQPLLTEALRGAGARIVDDRGVSVMREYHRLGDLAPRDVVARTIYTLECVGRNVWLDATRVPDVCSRFPAAYQACLSYSFELAEEPVPITPAEHYHMGGIAVDLDGRSSLPGLWAVGEAACTGFHGANRLASNSLLEAVVLGRRLGQALNREYRHASGDLIVSPVPGDQLADEDTERVLRECMWRSMGLVRDARGLSEGLTCIARLRERTSVLALLTRSRLLLAEQMMRAAACRRVNRGAHYRSDAEEEPVHRVVHLI
jgi:L-aspartate oxidase